MTWSWKVAPAPCSEPPSQVSLLSFLMGCKLLSQQHIYGGEQAPRHSAGPGSHSKSLCIYTFDNSSQARGQEYHFQASRSQQREQQGNKKMSKPASALFLIELWCGSGYMRGRQSECMASNALSIIHPCAEGRQFFMALSEAGHKYSFTGGKWPKGWRMNIWVACQGTMWNASRSLFFCLQPL